MMLEEVPRPVGDGHLEQPGFEQWSDDLVPELGPVGSSRWAYEFRQRARNVRKFKHLARRRIRHCPRILKAGNSPALAIA